MKTDDLIEALAAGTTPIRPRRLEAGLALWALPAAIAAFLGVIFVLGGVRPDLAQAVQGPTFWMKAAYTVLLALAGGWLFTRLGRPGTSTRAPMLTVIVLMAIAGLLGWANYLTAPQAMRPHVLLGHSWKVCTANIVGLSLLTAPFIFWAARRFAPTRPTLAGFAAGISAGGLAATLYGVYCIESTAAFVAAWYTLGILAAGAIGAVIGRFWLRW
jgi:hypothetical protein